MKNQASRIKRLERERRSGEYQFLVVEKLDGLDIEAEMDRLGVKRESNKELCVIATGVPIRVNNKKFCDL